MQLFLSLFQPEEEFRDKLSPIYISLNFSLDPQAPLDQHGLRPILNYETEQLIKQKVCTSSNDRIMQNAVTIHCCMHVETDAGMVELNKQFEDVAYYYY